MVKHTKLFQLNSKQDGGCMQGDDWVSNYRQRATGEWSVHG